MLRFMLPLSLLLACCSVHAQSPATWQEPFPSIVDVEAMRDQFLQQAGVWADVGPRVHCRALDANFLPRFNRWGFVSLPLPRYLRPTGGDLPADCGVLITAVLPDSPAATWGLQPGMTIVELDGQPLPTTWDPAAVGEPHVLTVLTENGPITLQCLPELPAPADDPLASPRACGSPRSLSVSQVNGCYSVAAVFDSPDGPLPVELKGSRAEIELQLTELPAEIQASLREHLR